MKSQFDFSITCRENAVHFQAAEKYEEYSCHKDTYQTKTSSMKSVTCFNIQNVSIAVYTYLLCKDIVE